MQFLKRRLFGTFLMNLMQAMEVGSLRITQTIFVGWRETKNLRSYAQRHHWPSLTEHPWCGPAGYRARRFQSE